MTEPERVAWTLDDRQQLVSRLEFTETSTGGQPAVLICDTATQRYFRCPPDVARVVRLFDGSRSVRQVVRDASAMLREPVEDKEIFALLDQLRRFGFLVGTEPPRPDPVTWRRWIARPVYERELGRTFLGFARLFSPFFSRWLGPVTVVGILALTAYYVYLIAQTWDLVMGGMMRSMVHWPSYLLFLAVFVPITLLHEMGHAIAYVNYGGRRPRIGVILFFVIFIAFYTNVNDAYRFSSRWKRIAVSMAGGITNVILGIPLVVLWTMSSGVWAEIMLFTNVVNVLSLLAAVWPMVRADAYYALVDLLEVPNFYEKAVGFTWGNLRRLFGGSKPSVRAANAVQVVVFPFYALVSTLLVPIGYYVLFVHLVVLTPLSSAVEDTPVEEWPWMGRYLDLKREVITTLNGEMDMAGMNGTSVSQGANGTGGMDSMDMGGGNDTDALNGMGDGNATQASESAGGGMAMNDSMEGAMDEGGASTPGTSRSAPAATATAILASGAAAVALDGRRRRR